MVRYMVGTGRYNSRVLLKEFPQADFIIFQMLERWWFCVRQNDFEIELPGSTEWAATNTALPNLPASFVFEWKPSDIKNSRNLQKVLENAEGFEQLNVQQPV